MPLRQVSVGADYDNVVAPVGKDSVELPEPRDDGAADHVAGQSLPAIELASTATHPVQIDSLARRSVIFVYPAIGGPGADKLDDWTAIPGARGCTPEACSFRDMLTEFDAAGFDVYGLSNQAASVQREHVDRLGLPYPLLSDESMQLADTPGLPTFEFDGQRYYKRLTMIIDGGTITWVHYPVFPPERAADQVLRWIARME
jgi:peroxiredoxin